MSAGNVIVFAKLLSQIGLISFYSLFICMHSFALAALDTSPSIDAFSPIPPIEEISPDESHGIDNLLLLGDTSEVSRRERNSQRVC